MRDTYGSPRNSTAELCQGRTKEEQHIISIYVLFPVLPAAGIKNINVELEPGFQSAQKRDNCKLFTHIAIGTADLVFVSTLHVHSR